MMADSRRVYRGQLIGAAALTSLFWALPLVLYALFAQLNPDNRDAQQLAARWAGKNQSLALGLSAFIASVMLWFDTRQRRKMGAPWTLRRAMVFAVFIALFQWMIPLASSGREEFWVARTTEFSLMLFGFVVLTRLVAQETATLEGTRGSEKLERHAVTA